MTSQKNLPIWAIILLDLTALGIALCLYALFDHVLIFKQNDVQPIVSEILPSEQNPPVVPPEETVQLPTEPDSPPTEEQKIDVGLFGEKFQDRFEQEAIVTKTDTIYRSHDLNVTVTVMRAFDSDCYVADIYVRNPENLRTAFSSGSFNAARQTGKNIAMENNAICAINGDYTGFGNNPDGVVLRNGELYRDMPTNDVLAFYRDGSMKVFPITTAMNVPDFNGINELNAGALQAWCFGPTLVQDGQALTKFVKAILPKNPRTAIGYYEPGHYCFVTVDGRSDVSAGMRITELAEFMQSLGCTLAYNFDGGQSSTMIFGDRMINLPPPDEGVRKLSDIIYIAETNQSISYGGDLS